MIAKVLSIKEKKINSNGKEWNIKELNVELYRKKIKIKDRINEKSFSFKYATVTLFLNPYNKELYNTIRCKDIINLEEPTYEIQIYKKGNGEIGFNLIINSKGISIITNIDDEALKKLEKRGLKIDEFTENENTNKTNKELEEKSSKNNEKEQKGNNKVEYTLINEIDEIDF